MRDNGTRLAGAVLGLCAAALPAAAQSTSVTTYHNDMLRTGWNPTESKLTVANVGGGGFDLQQTVKLDSQVDAQPLVVANQTITGQGTHTVVYVATGGDTLYAIDGVTGSILTSRNFGTPVPQSSLPGQCNNNGPSIGITSTPAISVANKSLYLIADTYENGAAVFRLHSVNLSDLRDNQTPVVVTASHKLADGSSYAFNASGSRQRAALLLSGETIYAAFSSYCDNAAQTTRGWLLGWNAQNLAPLPHNELADADSSAQSSYFLNSIWMSGYGPSTASANNVVYVVTSNSDQNAYSATGNPDESVLKISPDLSSVQSVFTAPNRAQMDAQDNDFGSGGAMLTPYEPGPTPKLMLAAGKPGQMFLFDRSAGAGIKALSSYNIGPCWCGPSYFTGADGVGRVVTSGGAQVMTWKLNTPSNAPASLTEQTATSISSGQEGGFFTSISSNGTKAGSAIVWAVGRPTSVPGNVTLSAIDPSSGKVLYAAVAGSWASGNGNANIVPTIANGQAYVASNQQLSIFGLGSPKPAAAAPALVAAASQASGLVLAPGEHAIYGEVLTVGRDEMLIATRAGARLRVDYAAARQAGNVAAPVVGRASLVIGAYAPGGALIAENVEHAKPDQEVWPADR